MNRKTVNCSGFSNLPIKFFLKLTNASVPIVLSLSIVVGLMQLAINVLAFTGIFYLAWNYGIVVLVHWLGIWAAIPHMTGDIACIIAMLIIGFKILFGSRKKGE